MKHRISLLFVLMAGSSILLARNSSLDEPAKEPRHPDYITPAIEGYGKVVSLPTAAHQPRADSKIVVDVTHGGDTKQLAAALEKVCRFVNIYGGAGRESQKVEISIVLHGTATLTALNDKAYAKRFRTSGNPNLPCMRALRKAGVEIYVCGQSLIGKGGTPDQVADEVQVAVSALSALVNLQSDGFACIPLGN